MGAVAIGGGFEPPLHLSDSQSARCGTTIILSDVVGWVGIPV